MLRELSSESFVISRTYREDTLNSPRATLVLPCKNTLLSTVKYQQENLKTHTDTRTSCLYRVDLVKKRFW